MRKLVYHVVNILSMCGWILFVITVIPGILAHNSYASEFYFSVSQISISGALLLSMAKTILKDGTQKIERPGMWFFITLICVINSIGGILILLRR